jgi:Kef-type K+ transport system membrane component KefB
MSSHLYPRAGSAITSVFSGADPTTVNTADPLRLFIIQAGIIIVFTRILAYFLAKIRQPSVIAEVIGGILLGPTVFGRIPGFTEHIFPPVSVSYLNLVANIGLLLFLFLIGMEVDLRIIRKCAVSSTAISISGLIIPFGMGAAISLGIYNNFIDTAKVSYGHFLLFTGVAMSITALPVLARIVLDLNLMQTTVGNVVLAAGVANDVVGWILLALAIALTNASSGLTALYIFLVVIAWTLVLFFLVKPALYWIAKRNGSIANGPSRSMIFIILLLVLASGFMTDVIGVQAIFGGFLVGLIIPHENGFAVALTEKIEDVVTVLFLPLFFTLSGLSTNLGTLDNGITWGYTIAIIIVAYASKFIGCAIPARLTGFSIRESAAIGTLMSCKGLVELIVLNVGLQAGILNTRVFSMFVVMALVTTCITTPLTQLVYPVRHRKFVKSDDDIPKTHKEKEGESQDDSQTPSKRFLVVLDRLDHLPGVLSFLQLLKPTGSLVMGSERADASPSLRHRTKESSGDRTASDVDESSNGHGDLPVLLSSNKRAAHSTSLDAVRLVELTERTSAVMRVAEQEDTLRADPMVNVFKTFASLNKMTARASMIVSAVDDFSSGIVNRANQYGSDLILVPWTLPTIESSQGVASSSNFLNPMESFFGGGQSEKAVTRYQQAALVRKVIQDSPCDVGLLLDRNYGDSSPAAFYPHIMLGFMGGPDDRRALTLALRMCRANDEVSVSVYRFKKTDAGEDVKSPQNTFHHTESMRKAPAGVVGVQDTQYPHSSGFTPLQAQLEDDLAIRHVEETLAQSTSSSRFKIEEISTPTPLQDLITLVNKNTETSLIMLGRNRRMPTITHRNELRRILSPSQEESASPTERETKILNSETCTVIGEAGIAVSRACTLQAPILIIASALTSATRPQDSPA